MARRSGISTSSRWQAQTRPVRVAPLLKRAPRPVLVKHHDPFKSFVFSIEVLLTAAVTPPSAARLLVWCCLCRYMFFMSRFAISNISPGS